MTLKNVEEFLTLREALAHPRPQPLEPASEPVAPVARGVQEERELLEAIRAARLFHAAVADAVSGSARRLLEDIACDVVARELQSAPADLEAIVDRALARFAGEDPVCVHVHPSDIAAVTTDLPLVPDETLKPGDAIVQLRCGSADVTLGARLALVFQSLSP